MVDYPFVNTNRYSININRRTQGFDSGWLLSEMHRATGSVNFPQLLNRLETKTGQVRNLMFRREAIGNKEFRTTKSDNSTSLAGPGVSFGYEDGTNTTINTTGTTTGGLAGSLPVNKTHHKKYPELNLFPIKALQTPITSYGGVQGKGGYVEQGTCKFYMPSRGYLRNYVQFQNEFRFRQIEPQDKLIDVDRVAWAFPTAVNTKQIGEGPSPTVYPNALLGGDTTPRTDRRWANQQSTIADKGLRAQEFSFYGPSYSAATPWAGRSNVVTGADCKRLRAVMKANFGQVWNLDYNIPEVSTYVAGIGKTYTWDETYSGETVWGNTFTKTVATVISTVGLVCIYMQIVIPDDASVDNSHISYESRAANDKARTRTNQRHVYGHWTFTAPDNDFLEQTHRSSGTFGGEEYSFGKMDFIQFPVNEPVVIDLPFYDVEVGDTRTLNIMGREYIATFGASTRPLGAQFSSSSGGPQGGSVTQQWSDGTQTDLWGGNWQDPDAGQVGASWDIDRMVYTENIGGSETNAGEMSEVTFLMCTNRPQFVSDNYAYTGTSGDQPDGKVGIPLHKFATVNNTNAATSTITITDFTELNAGDKVNLVATDDTNYDFVQGDQSSVAGTFEATTSNNQTATNLMNVINTSSGPSGTRFTATVDGAVVTATQATGGTDGNTTVTLTDSGTTGMSKTNFTGGTANTYAVGTTEIAVDNWNSVPVTAKRVGSPLFTGSYEYLGIIASTNAPTDTLVTLEAPGSVTTVSDGSQLYSYPRTGVDHWVQDIIDGVPELVMEELYLYEDAEWTVNSIKDYKDEYQEVRCTKVRGKRHSRRFAHG